MTRTRAGSAATGSITLNESGFDLEVSRTDEVDLQTSDRRLADKLDRLSTPTAENVLQRAIEIHHSEQYDDSTMSLDDLERVGLELGIPPATIRQALRNELEAEHDDRPSWIERLIVPKRVAGGLVVDGDAERAAEALEAFLVEHEGVFEVSRVGTSVTWSGQRVAGRLSTFMGPAANGSGTLERSGSVTTRLVEVGDGDQLLEVTVDTSKILRQTLGGTTGFLAVGAVLGALMAGLFGTSPPDFLPSILEFFVPFLGFGLPGFAVMVWEARTSVRSVRQSVNRVLHTVRSRLRRGDSSPG